MQINNKTIIEFGSYGGRQGQHKYLDETQK